MKARQELLSSEGIDSSEPLIPAISCKGVNCYAQRSFGRLKKEVMNQAGISFKWKDLRPTNGQLALDLGGSYRSGITVNEARVNTDNGTVLLPRQSGPCVREGQ